MFTHPCVLRMGDTDAAGILYFANQFRFAHEAFESFLHANGFDLQTILTQSPYVFVIVHAESDYKQALHMGDVFTVEVEVSHIGTTSFSLAYTMRRENAIVGTAKTVHVCLEKKTWEKHPLPENFEAFLRIKN